MTVMEKIERATQAHRKNYDLLAERVCLLEAAIEALKIRRMQGIKNAVQAAKETEAKLAALIEQHPQQFEKPRTVTIAGFRVGITKGRGKIVWDNAQAVCRQIRKHFPENADALIKVTESPIKSALANLSTAEIKRIGATVEDTGDTIVINAVDGNVDKLVNALLADVEELEAVA